MPERACRILIADDHGAIRRGVRALLESHEGWQIVGEAANGLDALQLAHETQPDVAILDYSLPQIDGLELTRRIKRELPLTETLIYTMLDRESLLVQLVEAGALGYVLKSDAPAELIAAIDALARRKRYFSATVLEMLPKLFPEAADDNGRAASLTPREREVVHLIAEGKTSEQIADMLNIGIETAEAHRDAAMRKLDLHTTAEIAIYTMRNDIMLP
jgi:DNA-binding NarL/FixJ family response regulator